MNKEESEHKKRNRIIVFLISVGIGFIAGMIINGINFIELHFNSIILTVLLIVVFLLCIYLLNSYRLYCKKKKYRPKCIMWDDMGVAGSTTTRMTDQKNREL